MFWELNAIKRTSLTEDISPERCGRFVLHRHRDSQGEHLDLRLEGDGCLVGWRISGTSLTQGTWATENPPHPLVWLDDDHDAVREMDGQYVLERRDSSQCCVQLWSGSEGLELTLRRLPDISSDTVGTLAGMVQKKNIAFDALPRLVEDGLEARTRAIERFCGLSRVLDGEGFDEAGWRRLLAGMTLGEIGERLAKVEVRYDRVHPPTPVTRPEPLDEPETQERRTAQAFEIARE